MRRSHEVGWKKCVRKEMTSDDRHYIVGSAIGRSRSFLQPLYRPLPPESIHTFCVAEGDDQV
jgi:hypothetical protein